MMQMKIDDDGSGLSVLEDVIERLLSDTVEGGFDRRRQPFDFLQVELVDDAAPPFDGVEAGTQGSRQAELVKEPRAQLKD